MTTAEGNKLIAEFMGFDFTNEIITEYPSGLGEMVYDREMTEDDLKYYNSWDWLMPVWKKIHSIPSAVTSLRLRQGRLTGSIFRTLEYADINETWKAVIQFIEWYNKNQKP